MLEPEDLSMGSVDEAFGKLLDARPKPKRGQTFRESVVVETALHQSREALRAVWEGTKNQESYPESLRGQIAALLAK